MIGQFLKTLQCFHWLIQISEQPYPRARITFRQSFMPFLRVKVAAVSPLGSSMLTFVSGDERMASTSVILFFLRQSIRELLPSASSRENLVFSLAAKSFAMEKRRMYKTRTTKGRVKKN